MFVLLWSVARRYVDPTERVWAAHGLVTALATSALNGDIDRSVVLNVMSELQNPDNIAKYPEFVEVGKRIVGKAEYRV